MTGILPASTVLTHRPALAHRRLTRLLVLWLLALVLPLQGAAIGVLAAKGPAHVHAQPAAEPVRLVLEDVRRWKPATRVGNAHVFAALGHFHATSAVERHRHVADTAGVLPAPADEPAGDEPIGSAALSVLALIPVVALPGSVDATTPAVPRPGWSLRTGFTQPFERPPRQA